MDYLLKILRKNNQILLTIIISLAVSSFVGAVFGYYGASLVNNKLENNESLLTYPIPKEINSLPKGLDESTAVVNIVKKYSPAVVSIVATKDLPVFERTFNPFSGFCDDPFFSQFFDCGNDSFGFRQKGFEKRQVGAGTGFIVKSNGLVVTNKHVVSDESASYTVITNNGTKYSAKVLDRDPFQDLAIVKIEAQGLPTVELGDSDSLEVGQTVVAIGNALGEFSNSVSKGIVSGLSRSITASSGQSSERLEKVIQTDTAINPGNSGGPLLNLRGQVVGITTAMVSGAQNVGFAIPINKVKKIIQDVELRGKISYPYLGVRYIIINEDIKKSKNLPANYGALIVGSESGDPAVLPNSPAAKAGLKEGDIILEVNGIKIDENHTLAEIIQSQKIGDKIVVKIRRADSELNLNVILEEKK